MRQGKTGTSCTDAQRKWNAGTRKNAELKRVKHINFKCHKADHIHEGSSASASTSDPTGATSAECAPKLFKDHREFKTYIRSSVMAPLYQLQTNGPLQQCYRLVVDESSQSQNDLQIPHTEHSTMLTCRKCLSFYESNVQLSPAQVEKLSEETQIQSASQLWHDARKLRLTASTAKRVPKRSTTNPQKFLSEHLHPTFTGNTATKYGKENEEKAIELMEAQGHTVERRGLVLCPDHPWFGASPDGILDSTQLLEIKCPLKSSTSLAEFLSQPTGDIRCLEDGSYFILPNGPRGYYLQVGTF